MLIIGYKVSPQMAARLAAGTALDHEVEPANLSIVTVHKPWCYTCEQDWSPEVASRPCPGDPSEQRKN